MCATGSRRLVDSITKVLESNTSGPNTIAQKAAEAALDGPQDCVAEMVAAYRHRRDLTVDLLAEAEMLLQALKQPGCVGTIRAALIEHLGRRYRRSFADVWELVASLKEAAPDLDLDSPLARR